MSPKIYLTVDNCFAYKRWTKPAEWCEKIAGLGVGYVEASADNELDPLFMGSDYLRAWVKQVRDAEKSTGVKVANLYSGHGTYTTLGLTHTDKSVRRRMMEKWFKPMIEIAAELGVGLGFFAHAFPEYAIQNRDSYLEYISLLENSLVELNIYAESAGCGKVGIEQMYTPHQYPWTIEQTGKLLKNVTKRSGRGFYFTEDVGHHQQKFQMPTLELLEQWRKSDYKGRWLGTAKIFSKAEKGADAAELLNEMQKLPHLFASAEDGDCYAWIQKLGCCSPIIHLQQTDGRSSAHLPFTDMENSKGVVKGDKLLSAIKKAYDQPVDPDMPQRCDEIHLTLELFAGTSTIMRDFMEDCKTSVAYWRQWIPKDGLTLNELLGKINK